jgi:hypothetical protein
MMPQETLIANEFDEFCKVCFKDLTEQQFIDLRRTFFGGASALWFLVMNKLSEGQDVTDADMEMAQNLHREIFQFNEDVKAGKK